MECSSMFFPIQVKEELLDDGYDTSQTSMSGYYSPATHYPPQSQQQLSGQHPGIKSEPVDPRDSPGAVNHRMVHHHQHHPSQQQQQQQQHQHHRNDNDMSGGATLAQLGGPPPHHISNHGSPYVTQHDPSLQSPGGHMSHHQPHQQHQQHHQQQQQQQQSMPCSTSPKPKKKKKKKPSSRDLEMPCVPSPMNNNNISDDLSKKVKQEKITDTFKVRKKVDRFNGMPEEEVVKRTLPDHLATELDIVIIGINPGLFAAFKGHHYAGPGNHFWKCLYLSGLIPNPMTADDDFRLIEFGIGFTNIVSRTTRGSADLARKEIREGAQVLQEKIQKYKPKIAVFNGKGIYEVFSGKKNFDFGKQPEPMEGTNTVVYVMPSSSARCAQLPRAVDKVPFYVALKKLRDHLCGRLPVLRDSEVCFPDVKLKIESRDGAVKTEPVDQDHDEEEETRMRLDGGSGEAAAAYGSLQGQLMHSQRNFHQHPLGRAALAAAAAAGGYMEISLARAGMTNNGGRPADGGHKSAGGDPSKKKSSKKKRRSEDGDEDGDGRSDLLKRIKTENPYGESTSNCSSPGRPSSVDYHTSGHPRPPSHGPPPAAHSSTLQRSSYNGAGGYPMSPPAGEHSSPLYSPYHHQAHIKTEKGVDSHPLHGHHLDGSGGRSPTLLGSYAASVGCLYNPAGYGQPAPPPYFGSPPPPNPYGTYHHLSAHLPLNHHALNHHHHHHHSHHHRSGGGGGNLNTLASQSAAAELFATAAAAGLRENGLHHPTARHHLQQAHQQQMQQQQQQHEYYGSVHAQGGPVGGVTSTGGGGGPPPPYPSPLPPAPSSHKDSSPSSGSASGGAAAFHQYPSPPTTSAPSSSAPYHPHLHHLQSATAAGGASASHNQYCSPPPPATDGGSTSSPSASSSNANNGLTSMYEHQSAPPLYANLDSIKVKQERDSTYGEY